MTTRRLLSIALVGFIGTLGGASVAAAQPTAKAPIAKAPIAKPAESSPSDPPSIVFFIATGEANACGSDCNAWIAADGKIDLAAAQRLRKLLAKLGRRKLPIFLHSPGGSVLGAIELGRLIRSRNIEVSVARTIPATCSRDRLPDKLCETLKRSGQDLVSGLDSSAAMCNSACVLALSGGAVRSVPPWVRLGVHAIGLDLGKTEIRGAVVAAATRAANSRIVEFLRDMGINKALFDMSNSVPHQSARFLQRDELVRFGIDTREFGETDWMFLEKPNVAIAKGFFARTTEVDPIHPEAILRLDCGAGKAMRLTFARERGGPISVGLRPLRVTLNGLRIDLPYAIRSGKFEVRATALRPDVIDSADDDKGAIAISGFDPDRDNEPQGRIILNMAGFSAAYAKLRKACDGSSGADSGCGVGDLSPRCMPEALRTWPPAMPPTAGGQAAWPSR
jgi:hypothetical protein